MLARRQLKPVRFLDSVEVQAALADIHIFGVGVADFDGDFFELG
jgi:hypothetical protein